MRNAHIKKIWSWRKLGYIYQVKLVTKRDEPCHNWKNVMPIYAEDYIEALHIKNGWIACGFHYLRIIL
jgi:hypothetical protein